MSNEPTLTKSITCDATATIGDGDATREIVIGFTFGEQGSSRTADAFADQAERLRGLPGGAEFAPAAIARTMEAAVLDLTSAFAAEATRLEAKAKRAAAARKAAATRAAGRTAKSKKAGPKPSSRADDSRWSGRGASGAW